MPSWMFLGGFPNTKSMSFASASSQYVNFGNNVADDYNTVFSWGVWVKPTTLPGFVSVITKIAATNVGYMIALGANDVQVFFSGTGSLYVTSTTTALSTGNWYFIAVTMDGTGTAAGTKIYVNGTVQSKSILNNNLTGSVANSVAMTMAADLAAGGNNPEQYYNGLIAQVTHWNAVLSQSDVTTLYGGGTPVNPLTQSFGANCDHYWPLGNAPDAISASGIKDRVGSVHGSPVNTPTVSAVVPP